MTKLQKLLWTRKFAALLLDWKGIILCALGTVIMCYGVVIGVCWFAKEVLK